MLGIVQEQLGGPCGCCRVNRMEENMIKQKGGGQVAVMHTGP